MKWRLWGRRRTFPIAIGETSVSEPRRKRILSLKDRLALYANEVRARASLLPQGIGKDALLKKADQAGYPLRRLPPDPTGGIADAEIKTPSHAAGRDP